MRSGVDSLAEGFLNAHRYASEVSPEVGLTQARKVAETICRNIFAREIGEPGKIMLDGMLQKLGGGKIIPGDILVPFHTIQAYGNLGSHPLEDGKTLDESYVRPCLAALNQVVTWYLLDYLNEDIPHELRHLLRTARNRPEPDRRRTDEAPDVSVAEPASNSRSLVEMIEAEDSSGAARWRLAAGLTVCGHVVSQDGDRILVGSRDGRVVLLDRDGSTIWTFLARERVAQVACWGPRPFYMSGTWDGATAAYVEEGFEWRSEMPGVVSAMAASTDGEKVVAGTWAGNVRAWQRDGTLLRSLRYRDAVSRLVVEAGGSAVIVGLADNSVASTGLDGEPRWSTLLSGRLSHLATWSHETLVASEDGVILWLTEDGHELRRHETTAPIVHFACSTDGGAIAWVDRRARLVLWERGQVRWDEQLPAMPDVLAVIGRGDAVTCAVALPTSELILYNRRKKDIRVRLAARARSMSFAASGIHATCLDVNGGLSFLELSVLHEWLTPPKVEYRLIHGSYREGRVSAISLELVNEGGREARDVEILVDGDFLRKSQSEVIPNIGQGQTCQVRRAIEPTRVGDLPIRISLKYRDEMGKNYSQSGEEFIRVESAGGSVE